MTPRADSLISQVSRLHAAGFDDQADELERVTIRNNYVPDLATWGVLA